MDLTQLLNSNVGKQIISGISDQTQTTEQDTASVINAAAPVLVGMLQKNAATQEGAHGIQGALEDHDGSILNNLAGFFGSGDTSDGNGILGHILGNNRGSVEKELSEKTGVSMADVSKILAMLAPVIMGYLGQQSRQTGQKGGGLTDLLGGLMGGSDASSIGGNILSSILKQAGGGQGKGGLGDVLGGLFGKK